MTRLRIVEVPNSKAPYLIVLDRTPDDVEMAQLTKKQLPTGCAGIVVFAEEIEVS